MKQHYKFTDLVNGYIEAVHFTNNGPDDNREDNAQLWQSLCVNMKVSGRNRAVFHVKQ